MVVGSMVCGGSVASTTICYVRRAVVKAVGSGRSHENFPGCMQQKCWVFFCTPLHQAGVQYMACDRNGSR